MRAVLANEGNVICTSCLFDGNSAFYFGGAVQAASVFRAVASEFDDQSAERGAIDIEGGAAVGLEDCLFQGNSANDGGAVGMDPSVHEIASATIVDCTFDANSADWSGGALFLSGSTSTMTVTGSTFRANTARMCAGGAYVGASDTITLTSSDSDWSSGADDNLPADVCGDASSYAFELESFVCTAGTCM